jgi:hypothetical protein
MAPVGFGTLELQVQPIDAEVTIDGQRWETSDPGHLAVDVGIGRHVITVRKAGYREYVGDVEIVEGRVTPLNVSLSAR